MLPAFRLVMRAFALGGTLMGLGRDGRREWGEV